MKTIEIKMWGTTVGTAVLNDENICYFQYDDDFINMGVEISPIVMPLARIPYSFKLSETFKGLPGLLADSLPDKFGNRIIDEWLLQNNRSIESFSSLDRLCYVGKRGMGALEFYPVINEVKSRSEKIEIEQMVDLCNKVLSDREDVVVSEEDDYINRLINVGTSAGGARAKAIVAYNRQKRTFKSGQIDAGKGYEYYIVKFGNIKNNYDKENADSDYYTRIEYAYYLLAKQAGINMTESELINNNGYHFMTKRFDRFVDTNGKMQKLHMQTLGGLAHFDFNDAGSVGYEQAATVMRKLELPISDIEQFYRRMVFNVIFRNNDDHVKNISFLMDKQGKWRLSPAYDITFSYNPNGVWTSKHQMKIFGKRDNILYDDLLKSATNMGLTTKKCKDIIAEIENSKLSWSDCALKASLPKKVIDNLAEKFVTLK